MPEGRFFARAPFCTYLRRTFMTTAAMKNDVRGGSASEKSTLRDFPANGTPSWGLGQWLLGFKGAGQLQKAMEVGPITCGGFSKYVSSLTSGRAKTPKEGFFLGC